MYFHFNALITGKENICNIIRIQWSANDAVGFIFLKLGKETVAKFLFGVELNLSWTVLGRNRVKLYTGFKMMWTAEKPISSKFDFTVNSFFISSVVINT